MIASAGMRRTRIPSCREPTMSCPCDARLLLHMAQPWAPSQLQRAGSGEKNNQRPDSLVQWIQFPSSRTRRLSGKKTDSSAMQITVAGIRVQNRLLRSNFMCMK